MQAPRVPGLRGLPNQYEAFKMSTSMIRYGGMMDDNNVFLLTIKH